MKSYNLGLVILMLLLFKTPIMAQNVGIGTANPTIAKLEVSGVAGSGATSAAFGTDGAGISIQRNWPTIGFNQYRDLVVANSQGRHMANGCASLMTMDPGSGSFIMDMFQSAPAGSFTSSGNRALSILNNGNIGLLGDASSNTGLIINRKSYNQNGTALIAGSLYHSYFCHGPSEDTYIRAGYQFGKVYINDIPNGDIYMGSGTSKVGINTYQPLATLSVNGDVSLKKSTMVGNQNIVAMDRQGASIVLSNPAGSYADIKGIAGGVDGLILYLIVDANTTIFHLSADEPNPSNRIITNFGSNLLITNDGGVLLIYDGISSRWRVISYAQ
ncbi:MAG: hypothetical protein RLZZ546_2203 [Bacteroidota bacterium]|jgi:hypothetical protein